MRFLCKKCVVECVYKEKLCREEKNEESLKELWIYYLYADRYYRRLYHRTCMAGRNCFRTTWNNLYKLNVLYRCTDGILLDLFCHCEYEQCKTCRKDYGCDCSNFLCNSRDCGTDHVCNRSYNSNRRWSV